MLGQTLIRLIKDEKELSPYLAIGPIIHPGTEKGQKVEKMLQLMAKTLSPSTPASSKACLLPPIPFRDSEDT